MGQKRSDLDTLPLCYAHHEEQHRIGWPRFIPTYELDVQEILRELREKPRMFIVDRAGINQRHFTVAYRGQEFFLTGVRDGVEKALSYALRACGEYLRDQLIQRRAA
jgi:hypothetical protein